MEEESTREGALVEGRMASLENRKKSAVGT